MMHTQRHRHTIARSRAPFLRRLLLPLGLAVVILLSLQGASVAAPTPSVVAWNDLSPDVAGTPDFVMNAFNPAEIDTYVSVAANRHKDPFHGLGSATGGLSGFDSQVFSNVKGTGVTMTVYYSRNNYDGNALQGPDMYGPLSCTGCNGQNPDRRVTAEWALRVTRDHVGTRSPTTAVIAFSQPVFLDEFIVASISQVSTSYENAIVRAFATADATGPVVKASEFINISALSDDSTLLHGLGLDSAPTTTNALSNIAVEMDGLTDVDGNGVFEGVGSGGDDGIYHIYGVGNQSAGRYGRAKWVYGSQPIQSIAVSYFPTDVASFTDYTYTTQWISAIFAPFSFSISPSAVAMGATHAGATDGGNLYAVGLTALGLALLTLFVVRRRRTSALAFDA